MPKIRKYLIIGIALLIGLGVQVNNALALYSPTISQRVRIIKQHVQESQAQNGSKSILEEVENFKAYDRAKRAANRETGIPGDARAAQEMIMNTFNLIKPFDTIAMIFNFNYVNEEYISNCLRDEIWSLETLRDFVGTEMVKAYMLRDTYHGNLLTEDYIYLVTQIDLLRTYGSLPTIPILGTEITSNEYFFGEKPKGPNPLNLYSAVGIFDSSDPTGCPDGEFEAAINQFLNSGETLINTVGKNSLFSAEKWGDIWSMAKANARTRAKQWIRENQISVTVGGEEGGRPQSLIKGGGPDKFVGNIKTQLNIAKNMVGPVTPLFNLAYWVGAQALEGVGAIAECVFYQKPDKIDVGSLVQGGVFRNCNDEQYKQYLKCQEAEQKGEVLDEDENIRCDRYRNTQESLSITDYTDKQVKLIQENAEAKKEVETAFIYSISLDSVAEQNIYFVDDVLWDMNGHIQRSYEAVDKKAGEGIPTLFRKIERLAAKQCANKQ